jgi:4-aminobutyrate aminotransferase-like enzyme
MKKRRVLLSTDGPDENIIKIKPPIIFNKQNADFLLENLHLVIAKI